MTHLTVENIYKNFRYVDTYYINETPDGTESIWKKSEQISMNGDIVNHAGYFLIGYDHRTEIQTKEEGHKFLIDFLHKIEDSAYQDIDPDDNFQTVIQFHDEEEKVYEIYEGFMDDLKKKLQTIRNKCIKYGCDFSYEEVGETFKEVPLVDEVDSATGLPYVTCRFVKVKVKGTAVINDWEFVASVEHTKEGNIYSKALTNVEIPYRYRSTQSCTCEHCNSNRQRKNTFIIRNVRTGDFKQVGKSCLRDYTGGMSASVATLMMSLKSVFGETEERPVSGMNWFQIYYNTKDVLQCTAECIRHWGYTKSDNSSSTKEKVKDIMVFLHGNTRNWHEEQRKRVRNMIESVNFDMNSPEAVKMSEDALAWISSQEGTSDYMHNLKVICSLKHCTMNRFGFLVSLFPTYNRDLEKQEQIRKEQEAGKQSDYVGSVGQRITVPVQSVKCLTSWESCYDGYSTTTTYIWKIVDDCGNIYTWKTSKWLNEEKPPKEIKGTVKEHKVYREIKQTELTRCKIQGIA